LAEFARVGTVAVAALVLSGVANALLVLGDWRALFRTLYGFLLLTKLALFVGMLAFAAANRFRLVPALAKSPDRAVVRHLRGHVLGEQILGLVVLLIVSVIGTLDPTA
jgi:putative copper resistance protein D